MTVGGEAATTITCNSGVWSGNVAIPDTVGDADSVAIHASFGTAPDDATHTVYALKDTVRPILGITPPPINSHNQGSYSFSGTCTDGHGPVNISVGGITTQGPCLEDAWEVTGLNVSSLTGESVMITADVRDAVGNPAVQLTQPILRDTVPPSVSVTNAPDINNANKDDYTISGSCDEVGKTVSVSIGSGFTRDTTCTDSGWSLSLVLTDTTDIEEGLVLAVVIVLYDDARNEGRDDDDSITKDIQAPTASITTAPSINLATDQSDYPIEGDCSEEGNDIVVTLRDSESGSVTKTVPCGNKASGEWEATVDVTGLAEGSVTIALEHEDDVGNAATIEDRAIVKDLQAPTLGIDSPLSPILLSNVEHYGIAGSCGASGESVTVVLTDAGSNRRDPESNPVCSDSNRWVAVFNASSLSDGIVTVTANHSDAAGNPATEGHATTDKNTFVPTVAITTYTAPINGGVDRENYTISGDCNDNGRNIDLGIFDESRRVVTSSLTCSSSSGWTTTENIGTLEDGTITIEASYTDTEGSNPANDDRQTIQQDTRKPKVSILNHEPIYSGNEQTYSVNGECSEIGTSVSVSFTDGTDTITPTAPDCSDTKTWTVGSVDVSSLNDGTVTINAEQTDTVGNQETGSRTVTKSDASVVLGVLSAPNINLSNRFAFLLDDYYIIRGTCAPSGRAKRIN